MNEKLSLTWHKFMEGSLPRSDDNDYYEHNGRDELPEYWIEIPKYIKRLK